MPNRDMAWNPNENVGNPTKSREVNDLIKTIKDLGEGNTGKKQRSAATKVLPTSTQLKRKSDTEIAEATGAKVKDIKHSINKIRNFFKNSFFHRLLYLRFVIQRKALAFASYVNYVGELKNKSEMEMIWIKMELNELNSEFGKTLRQKQ